MTKIAVIFKFKLMIRQTVTDVRDLRQVARRAVRAVSCDDSQLFQFLPTCSTFAVEAWRR